MEQIRTRIQEKRGVDYTEQQIRELAAVKLEKFLDPKAVRLISPAAVPEDAGVAAGLVERHLRPERNL